MKTIEIRSNINATIGTIQRLEKEREEEENRKRDEEFANRRKLAEEWQNAHPNLFKYTYASYYSKDNFNYDYGPVCKIYFYEWSDINREPIHFANYTRLYDFFDKVGLYIEYNDNSKIRSLSSCYIVCKPGSKELIVAATYDELRCEFQKIENLKKVLEPVPEI